jgi:hypothetical protein
MNSLQHVLMSTLLVLLIYLVFQNQQMRSELDALHVTQQAYAKTLAETLAPLAEKLEAINAVTTKLGGSADEETRNRINSLQKRLELYTVLTSINQSNSLRAEGKGAEAAAKLDSIKKPVWQAGDALSQYKTRLQGLMQPIDGLVTAWKAGNTGAAPDAIRKELEAILGELGK